MINEDDNRPMAVDAGAERTPPTVIIPKYALRTAIHQAERAVEEMQARIRDAETERDDLARKLGAQQDMIDRLTGERDYRTRHLRALQSPSNTGTPE